MTDAERKLAVAQMKSGMIETAYKRAIRSTSVVEIFEDGTVDGVLGETTSCGSVTLGTTQVTIAHLLPHTPKVVMATPKADANVWVSQDSDEVNIYLTASAAVDAMWIAEC